MEDKKVPEGMERFLRTELSREDNQEAVRRMLAGAPRRSPFQNPQDRSRLDVATHYDEAFRKTERVFADVIPASWRTREARRSGREIRARTLRKARRDRSRRAR